MSMDINDESGVPKVSVHYCENTLGGSRVLEVLRAAMTDAGVEGGEARADLIGHFCNRWNAAVAEAPPELQPEEDTGGPLRDGWQIAVGPGHSGYGVYAFFTEYPEEGAVCLATVDPSDVSKAPAQGFQLHGYLVYETKFGGHWNFHPKDELPAGDFLKHREHTQVFVRTGAVQTVHPADELGAFARWYVGEYGHAPDHRDAEVVKQFKAWCAARSTSAAGAANKERG